MKNPHISALREKLLQTLDDLRDRNNPMEPDRARAIAAVSGVLVDSARVEVEFIRATGGDTSTFLGETRMIEPITRTAIETTFAGGRGSPFQGLGAQQ